MWKHIFGQALLQLAFLLPLIFVGEHIIPEESGYVENGRNYDWDGSELYIRNMYDTPSRHFTVVFNTFVMMTLFNEINCRKISDEWNCLSGI
jgi:hypothetical protein